MKKKRVLLDVFEESVLPMLEQKHKKDAAKIQADIDENYLVYELDDEGKETKVKFTVSAPAKAVDEDGEETTEEERIAAAVKKAVGDLQAKSGGNKNPLGETKTKNADGKMIIPATVKRVSRVKNFIPAEINGYTPEERAYRLGQWALAALGNENAKNFCNEHGIGLVQMKAAHAEGTNTLGGYLVPEEFGQDLIDLRERYGVARKLLKVVSMSSDTRTDPRRTSGLTAYFVAENAAGTESNKGWDQVRLTAKDLMVLSRMSNQLNEDAVISIGDDLAGEISYAFALKEDQCAWLGDATSTYGGITGIVTKLTNVNGVDDGGGLVLAAGNLFSEFTLANFNAVVGLLPQYADTPNACWVAHRTFYYGTMQRLELAAGGVTANEVREGNRKPRPLFLGYPVEFAQVMPSTDANSQVACTFGDHAQAATFGDRRQDTIAFSEHATIGGESVFERNQIAVRGTERFDINVHDVGTSSAAGPVVGLISASS